MTYRTDTFKIGDMVTWFDEKYATITFGRAQVGDGPFRIQEVIDQPFHHLSAHNTSNWNAMGHTQHVYIEGWSTRFSGAFFKLVETVTSEEEAQQLKMEEITRRILIAKEALLMVDLDYNLRSGSISLDTMRDVTRALELLK